MESDEPDVILYDNNCDSTYEKKFLSCFNMDRRTSHMSYHSEDEVRRGVVKCDGTVFMFLWFSMADLELHIIYDFLFYVSSLWSYSRIKALLLC